MRHFKQKSYYGEKFDIQFKEYTGIDYSKVAFIFPGQGAAKPGMFKNELKKLPHCLKHFSEADEWAVNKKIGKISWYISSPHLIEKQNFYAIQNLALYVLEVGLFETLKQVNKNPEIVSAHSFGEYAALVSIGAIDFLTMLEIVYQREIYSPLPHEAGEMFAIACSFEYFSSFLCPVTYTMANENSYEQCVLSVSSQNKDEMTHFLKFHRLPFRELDTVGRPYHCPLMQKTADHISKWLENYTFKISPLKNTFISSVNNQRYEKNYIFSNTEFISLVTEQLTKPVYFTRQIEQIAQCQIHSFLELGLSGIYCDFIKNITAKIPDYYFSIQSLSILFNSVEEKSKSPSSFRYNLDKSPIFKVLTKYISHITGYDLIEIGIEDQFQEDLRIDSIKKAEIIFKTLEETNTQIEESLSLAQLRSVGEVVEFLEKIQQSPIYKKKKAKQGTSKDSFTSLTSSYESSPKTALYSLTKDQSSLKEYLRITLNQECAKSANKIGSFYYSQSPRQKCLILDLVPNKNTDHKLSSVDLFIQLTQEIKVFMSMLEKDVVPLQIILAAPFSNSEFYALNAFFKSLCREFGFLFKSIIHDLSIEQENEYWEMIRHESEDFFGIDIQYKNGNRLTKQWKPFEIKSNHDDKIRKKIIIIGGAKGLAFELFSRIQKSHEIEIVIWGRSTLSDPVVQKNIKILKKKFKRVEYLEVDALLKEAFFEAIASSRKILGCIELIINSAGVEYSRRFMDKSTEEIYLEASTKIIISENLRESNQKNEFDILHFSSIVGSFGNEGQTIYSYGNGFQAHLEGSVALLWPGLNQVGMTENLGILHKLKLSGIHLLEIADAANWFSGFLQSKSWGTIHPNAFAGPIVYMDPKDIFLMEFFIRNLLQFESLGGEIVSPKDLLFRKIYNSQIDSYLQDHVIENTSVVPASIAISSMICFGHLFYKDFPSLNDFEIKNIMMLLDGRDITCYSHYQFTPELTGLKPYLKISSLMTSQVEHFVASMTPRFENSANELARLSEFFNYKIELNDFYSKACIGFGSKFQNLEEIFYNDDNNKKNILGLGKSTPIYYTGLKMADTIISILESAFQTVSCFGIILGKGLAIPLRFSKLIIEKIDFKQFIICPDIIESNIDHDDLPLISNVIIYNEKNEVLVIIERLEMSTIRHHPTLPFKLLETSREL